MFHIVGMTELMRGALGCVGYAGQGAKTSKGYHPKLT
jgi:hypothetical protein